MTFAEKILYLRKEKNIPQNKIAKELKVSRQSIYKWESGACLPELDKIKKLAEIFEVSYDLLLNDEVSIIQNDNDIIIDSEKNFVKTNDTVINITDNPANENNDLKSAKKKNIKLLITTIVSATIMLICVILTLVQYLPKEQKQNEVLTVEHTEEHTLSLVQVYEEPTCDKKGRSLMQCDEANCNYTELVIQNPLGHQEKDGECTICGYIKGSYGILYATDDGETYFVKSIGRCTDENLVIANKCNGKDVTYIEKDAFNGNNKIKSVKIPSSVHTIKKNAFKNCNNLKEVTFTKGLKKIEGYAFYNCGIENLKLPSTLETIGTYSFFSNPIKNLTIGYYLNTIEQYAFDCNNLKELNCNERVWTVTIDNVSSKKVKLTKANLKLYSNKLWKLEE